MCGGDQIAPGRPKGELPHTSATFSAAGAWAGGVVAVGGCGLAGVATLGVGLAACGIGAIALSVGLGIAGDVVGQTIWNRALPAVGDAGSSVLDFVTFWDNGG
jgi:hypothetical protein